MYRVQDAAVQVRLSTKDARLLPDNHCLVFPRTYQLLLFCKAQDNIIPANVSFYVVFELRNTNKIDYSGFSARRRWITRSNYKIGPFTTG